MKTAYYILFALGTVLICGCTLPFDTNKVDPRVEVLREIAGSEVANVKLDNTLKHFFDDENLDLRQRELDLEPRHRKEYVGLTERYKNMSFDDALKDLAQRHARQNQSYRVSVGTINRESTYPSIKVELEIRVRKHGIRVLVTRVLDFAYYKKQLLHVENVCRTFREISDEKQANSESCVRPEQSGSVDTTLIEPARGGPSPQQSQ